MLSIPEFFADGQSIEIPFKVLHGSEAGKTLHVQVAQHGSEVMGLDALRRLILGSGVVGQLVQYFSH